jgi:hypothetical protein
MSKPLIQIDDLVREMTDAEYADFQERQANSVNLNLETTQE